jgi:group I intron endonuclease
MLFETGDYNQLIVPVMIYTNAYIQKEKFLQKMPGKSGIYRWINIENGKFYIGSAVDLRDRFWCYYSLKYLERNNNMIICKALLKHGYSNFNLENLEYCEASELLERENHYFELLGPE